MAFNSLKIKIVGMVSVIVIIAISYSTWQHHHKQKVVIEKIVEKHSILLTEVIVSNIQSAMKSGHTTSLTGILHSAKVDNYIKEVRIIDLEGTVLHSADPSDVGKQLTAEERDKILNTKQPFFYFINKENHLDSYTRILNKPDCHGCHDARNPFIAIIETEISLDDLTRFLHDEKRDAIVTALFMIILIIGTVFVFLTYYVDRPIRSLIDNMRQIELGNFGSSRQIQSSNEMSSLSVHLNAMAAKLNDLLNTTIINERELARAEENLAHHHDTLLMNQKLEEHLKEIENLNVSLEERIEEVEKASDTIADLAGELEQKNANLEQAIGRLSTIYNIGLAINSTMDIDRLFNLIVRTTTNTLNAQIGYIILFDKEQQTLNVTNLISNGKLSTPHLPIKMKDTSTSVWVINSRQPLLISDINETPQFDRFSALGYERKTLICAPLMVNDEIIGTISVVNKSDNSRFQKYELEMLSTIAAQAAIAIKNATLYEEQQQNYLNTIQALVTAIEASDSYTKGHSERVTRYSMEIGNRLNIPSDRLQILERAAILHDIGKIGIDLSLLHKEGKLSSHDVNELHLHPEIGMNILEPIEFLKDVRTCIGQHHERYDGMGYPHRIKHFDQLLESRIIGVADAFDAMTSDRPYRKALTLEAAISELSENSGTQFDPAIVEIFISVLDEGTFFASRFDRSPITSQQALSA